MTIDNYDAMPLKPMALPPVGLDLDEYVFEWKLNGHRWLVESDPHTDPPYVTARTRQGNLPAIDRPELMRQIPAAFPEHHVVLDGELVGFTRRGEQDLGELRKGARRLRQDGSTLIYFAFDVLEVEGQPVIDEPFRKRRQRLETMYRKGTAPSVQLVPQFVPDRFAPSVRQAKLVEMLLSLHKDNAEGIVAKRLDGRYNAHNPRLRTDDQLKYRFPIQ